MVAKLVLFLLVVAVIFSVAITMVYRYFKQREKHRHEKEMLREQRDAELLTETDDYIERELDRERTE